MLIPTASYLFGPVVSLFLSSMQTLEFSTIFGLLRRRFFLLGGLQMALTREGSCGEPELWDAEVENLLGLWGGG